MMRGPVGAFVLPMLIATLAWSATIPAQQASMTSTLASPPAASIAGATTSGATTLRGVPAPTLSPATNATQAGLIDIRSLVPDIAQDIKYAGSDNFVGAPVQGYLAPKCLLLPPAATALARVEHALRAQHLRLKVWDCYRPARAVAHFVRWANDPADQQTKAQHYPALDKSQLLNGYIAPVSGHSRGSTVDLTLARCVTDPLDCTPLDMGTDFEFFDPRAHTDTAGISAQQRSNRQLLRDAMTREGFRNYALEWWHYMLTPEVAPATMFDVPVE